MIQSPDGRPRARERGEPRSSRPRPSTRSRGPRPLPRSEERAEAGLRAGSRRETGQVLNTVRERSTAGRRATRRSSSSAGARPRAHRGGRRRHASRGTTRPRGHYHLITQVRREVEDVFLGLGYNVVDGDEVEDTWHLFDALNMPPGHVTRSPLHTLFLNGDVVLRTETSPSQIRVMETQDPPVYIVCSDARTGATPPTPRTARCSIRSRGSRSTRASRLPT